MTGTQASLFDTGTRRGAYLSADQQYRYRLWRIWSKTAPPDVWIMLNPSTADADMDDPTIRRCMGFSRGWGSGGILVLNLFAYRSPDPKQLASAPDPIGPENDVILRQECQARHDARIICAWGSHITAGIGGRGHVVKTLIQALGIQVYCLGVTQAGYPKHPLYIPSRTHYSVFS